jgi:hypothetical protein
VTEDESYLEIIKSKEIQKIVDIIYSSKPEDALPQEQKVTNYENVEQLIDELQSEPVKEKKRFFQRK